MADLDWVRAGWAAARRPEHADTARTIAFRPERYGHAVAMTPTLLSDLAATGAPIEICPTSNLRTLALGSDYRRHPTIGHWLEAGHPIAICTDDTSLFGITLSDELARVGLAFGLSRRELAALALGALDAVFERRRGVVEGLRERMEAEVAAALGEPAVQRL